MLMLTSTTKIKATMNQDVVGSNPGTVYWMDGSDASYYKKHTKIKLAEWGTPKKIF